MSVKSRLDKIRQASQNAVLCVQYSHTRSVWSVRSLSDPSKNYRIVVEWRKASKLEDITSPMVECKCSLVTAADGLIPCKGNNGTMCYHSLAVLMKAADEKDKNLVLNFDGFSDAHHYSNFGGQLIKITNDHQGYCWGVVEVKRESRLVENVSKMRGPVEEGID